MFDWIDNLARGGVYVTWTAVGIFVSYASWMILGLYQNLFYDVVGIKGCSFKHPVLASNMMPCRSTLIGEIL